MIANRALTFKEQDVAQKIYVGYSGLGTLCVTCSGLTLQVLLAIYLGISDTAISCMGAFEYLKYLGLPFLGCFLAGKFGVMRILRNYAMLNGIACFVIAFAALSPQLELRMVGLPLFFLGLFFLYSSEGCSASTSFALQKNITRDQTLPRMTSRVQQLGAVAGLLINLAIAGLFAMTTNHVALPVIFCLAGLLFYFKGRRIARMPEPSILQTLAAQPMLPQMKLAWKNSLIRRVLLVGAIQNLVFVTMIPVNLLAVKQGCKIDNARVLILTSLQLISMFFVAFGYKAFCSRFGPRKVMILTCPIVWFTAAYWVLVPVEHSFWLLIVPFMLTSVISIGFSTAMGNYIVMAVPNELQMGATILVFLIHGGLVGIIGIFANPVLFRIISTFAGTEPMSLYRWYYLIVGLISLPGILASFSLPVLYLKYRAQQESAKNA